MKGRDIIRVQDLSRREVEEIHELAREYEPTWKAGSWDILKGQVLASLYFQPSTRTMFTFQTAMLKLGGGNVAWAGIEMTSYKKGEKFADGIRMVDSFVNAIVIRHPENGGPQRTADIAGIPVISAGDGTNEHPTNAILEIYYIEKVKGKLSDLTISIWGNLKGERCAHSLAYACAMFGSKLIFVAPEECRMPEGVTADIKKLYNAKVTEMGPEEALKASDVIYVQPIFNKYFHYFKDPMEPYRAKHKYSVDLNMVKRLAKEDLLVLGSLPRLEELAPDLDETGYQGYFKMYDIAVPVRMAILAKILGPA